MRFKILLANNVKFWYYNIRGVYMLITLLIICIFITSLILFLLARKNQESASYAGSVFLLIVSSIAVTILSFSILGVQATSKNFLIEHNNKVSELQKVLEINIDENTDELIIEQYEKATKDAKDINSAIQKDKKYRKSIWTSWFVVGNINEYKTVNIPQE